jgi:two-component system chemotaxis response regulator CheB
VAADRRIHTFVVGASAGGVEALRDLVAVLPGDFPAVILVVLHLAPSGTSVLPQILQRAGELRASQPADGCVLQGGHIYVAPPDYHLVVDDGHCRLDRGPRVNGHRPAVDTLFRSAAAAYGSGVAGVILSGVLDDGSAGLMAIKKRGGVTLVQEPGQALYDAMPRNAIDLVQPDRIATAEELGLLMAELATRPPDDPAVAEARDPEAEAVIAVDRGASDRPQPGEVTGLTCPECNGAIWESLEDGLIRLRCRTGHEYGPETFVADQDKRVEVALWTALRTLEERAALHRRIAARQRERGNNRTAERFALRADVSVEHAIALRRVLAELETPHDAEGAA